MVCAPIHVSVLQQGSTCIVPWLGYTRTEMRDSRPTGAPLYSAARPGVAGEEPWGRATGLQGHAVPVHACSSRHGAANLFRMRVLRVFFCRRPLSSWRLFLRR